MVADIEHRPTFDLIQFFRKSRIGAFSRQQKRFFPAKIGYIGQRRFVGYPRLRHQQIKVGIPVARVRIQRPFAISAGGVEVADLHQHPGSHDQRIFGTARGGGRRRFHPRISVDGDYFFDTAQQILDETDPAHILRLEHRQLSGKFVSIHVAETGDQEFPPIRLHQLQIAAPLVAHPRRVEMRWRGAHHQHDPRRVQRGEDVGLVLLPKFGFQRDAGKEDLVPRLGQRVIDLLRRHRIAGTLTVFVALLVADEDVEGLLLRGDGEDALADLFDPLGLLFIYFAFAVARVFHRREIIRVGKHRFGADAVAGGDALMRSGVFDVFDAVTRQNHPPMRLRVFGNGGDDLRIRPDRLVELPQTAEVFRPVVEPLLLLRFDFGERDQTSAVLAGIAENPFPQPDRGTAHLA